MPKSTKKKYGMPKPKATPAEEPNPEGEEILRWTVSPFRYEQRKAQILSLSSVGFLLLVYWSYREISWVLFGAVLIIAAFNSFIFPSTYRLTTKGVGIRTGINSTYKEWEHYKSYKSFPDGVYLALGTGKKSRNGHFLYFGDSSGADILAIVEKYMSRDNFTN